MRTFNDFINEFRKSKEGGDFGREPDRSVYRQSKEGPSEYRSSNEGKLDLIDHYGNFSISTIELPGAYTKSAFPFETMVFGPPTYSRPSFEARHATKEEATQVHQAVIAKLKSGMPIRQIKELFRQKRLI